MASTLGKAGSSSEASWPGFSEEDSIGRSVVVPLRPSSPVSAYYVSSVSSETSTSSSTWLLEQPVRSRESMIIKITVSRDAFFTVQLLQSNKRITSIIL